MATIILHDALRKVDYEVETAEQNEPSIIRLTPEEEEITPDAQEGALQKYDHFRQVLADALIAQEADTGLRYIDTGLQADTATAMIIFQPDRDDPTMELAPGIFSEIFSAYKLSRFAVIPDFRSEEITIELEIKFKTMEQKN